MRPPPIVVIATLVTALTLSTAGRSLRQFLAADAKRPPAGQNALPRPGATLVWLQLHGPSFVRERSGGRFTLIARYSDGSSVDVTDRADWSVDSSCAVISRGDLTALGVTRDEAVTVSAWFTDGLSLKASRTVIVYPLAERSPRPGEFSNRDDASPLPRRDA